MNRLVKICFITCLFGLLIGCSNQQEKQSTTSPPNQSASDHGSSNQTHQNIESEQPSNNKPNTPPNITNNKKTTLIHEIVALAKVGTVPNCSFPADTTTIDQVIAKWGNPDKQDFVAGNRYATYTSRGIVFGINKGEQIFDVRSYSKEIQQITFENVKEVLGKPNEVHYNSGDTIWVYNVNNTFQLKFVGSKTTIDHISVFCPADAKNNMAG